ncbi:MAG TPA: SDR family NAD(P)-dependent oxidoreductase, partial [Candidatus Acidoferrum sp.]|nr:SDR family NAD(P)-dependent oxidoreductase [Candidatus Acidoferrum sp.]
MSTILITGANRGLGLEFARQYAADGWEVLAASRQPDKATELKQLAAQHPTVVLHRLDITDDESVQDLADKLDGKPIDVLLHSSGIYPREGQHIGEIDYDGWRRAMETNLFGVMRVTEALLKNVAASQRKQIAAISTSLSCLRGVQDGSVAQAGTS